MIKNAKDIKKVFISYVKENRDEIDNICKCLKENNVEYWLDKEDIETGRFWKESIKNAINNGAFFMACFSKESEGKPKTYMRAELLIAIETLKIKPYDSGWLIPIKLSDCEIPDIDIGGNRTLKDIQYLDFYKDWDTSITRLIDQIRREEDSKDLPNDEFFDKQLLYEGLKALIEKGDGDGFHNADLGHPVYVAGAMGEFQKMWEYADSPNKNLLFEKLSKLSIDLKGMGIEEYRFVWWYDFSEWRDFCKFALDVYNKQRSL